MTQHDNKLTVYFDGACPLCSIEIAHYKRQEGADTLRFVDVSDPASDPGPDLPREAAMKRFHVRTPDGQLTSGASGFTLIWRTLPRWRWAARLAALPGLTPMLELLYRIFLPIRPYLSRLIRKRS